MRGRALLSALALSAIAAPVLAEPTGGLCAEGKCRVVLNADQLASNAFALVQEKRFDEAAPLIAALENIPEMGVARHFLAGYVAVEQGEVDTGVRQFRAALAIDPKQTRVRLELARAMMLLGKTGAADYNFRLAQQDANLPPDIVATIRGSRGILRDLRPWHFSSTFGFAPDTNITNGTAAQTVDVVLGDQTLPLTLDGNARQRSGLGQTASLSAGYRFTLGERAALLLDADGQGVNYKGSSADDYTLQLAAGPEFRPSDRFSLSLQGIGLQRWFGGSRAVTQVGGRVAMQRTLNEASRVGLTLDARHSASGFATAYSGWNFAAFATYERVVARSMVASASIFARRDRLNDSSYSSRELGVSLGIGGELAHGINAGLSGNVSRARFDAPLALFATEPRGDWRFSTRVYAGIRSIRVLGFSPSASYIFSRNASSLDLYESKRSRLEFALARYF